MLFNKNITLSIEGFDVFIFIEEGMNNFNRVNINTGIEIPKLKQIFLKLEREGYVNIRKSFDNEYGEENSVATITEKGKHYLDKVPGVKFLNSCLWIFILFHMIIIMFYNIII